MVWKVTPVAIVVIIMALGVSAAPKTVEPTGGRHGDTEQSAATRKLLDRPMGDIRMENVRLADALAGIAEVAGLELAPDWAVLEKAGVRKETRLTARMRGPSAGKALEIILESAASPKVKLVPAVKRDGSVLITTYAEYAAIYRFEKRHDIKDLIARAAGKEKETAEALMRLVRESVDPLGWTEAGGPFTIQYEGGELVVSTLEENHASIADLLGLIRRAR
jgi:hypothetical protein